MTEEEAEPDQEEEQDPVDKVYKQYLDERKENIDAARESARTFDKAVLTFSSAVFGFSIAFLKDVAPHPTRDTLLWLGLAWLLFSCALLLILLSFLFSHRACMFEIECATKKIANPDCVTEDNKWSGRTDFCNFACIILLFVGLLSWSVFAFQNLGREGSGAMDKAVKEPAEKKGYVPPPAPAKVPAQQPTHSTPSPGEKK